MLNDGVIAKLLFPFHLTRCNIKNTKSFLYVICLERHKKQKLQLAASKTVPEYWVRNATSVGNI